MNKGNFPLVTVNIVFSILNIVSNCIPHETVICDDRDPPWINTRIKNLINDTKILYKKCLYSGKNTKVRLLI